jgi:hypothetical protein
VSGMIEDELSSKTIHNTVTLLRTMLAGKRGRVPCDGVSRSTIQRWGSNFHHWNPARSRRRHQNRSGHSSVRRKSWAASVTLHTPSHPGTIIRVDRLNPGPDFCRSIAGNERPPSDMVEAIHSLRYFHGLRRRRSGLLMGRATPGNGSASTSEAELHPAQKNESQSNHDAQRDVCQTRTPEQVHDGQQKESQTDGQIPPSPVL